MGTLGWTEADTLETSMSAILLAYEGRMDLLKSIFGGGEADKGKKPHTPATPDKVRGALRMLAGGDRAGTKQRSGKGKRK